MRDLQVQNHNLKASILQCSLEVEGWFHFLHQTWGNSSLPGTPVNSSTPLLLYQWVTWEASTCPTNGYYWSYFSVKDTSIEVERFTHTPPLEGWKMWVSHKGFLIPVPGLCSFWVNYFLLKPSLVPDEQMQLEPWIASSGIWWVYPWISRMEQVICRGLLCEYYRDRVFYG